MSGRIAAALLMSRARTGARRRPNGRKGGQNGRGHAGRAARRAGGGAPNGAENAEPEKDWKAEYERVLRHSRTWEDKAKRLKEKADRLDELEEATKTDAERLADVTKRAEDAEARLAEYERERDRAAIVAEVAAAKGIDAEWLGRMTGDTREEVEANADFVASKLSGAPIYPSVPDNGGGKGAPLTREQIEAIKDPKERVRMRARHIDLYR